MNKTEEPSNKEKVLCFINGVVYSPSHSISLCRTTKLWLRCLRQEAVLLPYVWLEQRHRPCPFSPLKWDSPSTTNWQSLLYSFRTGCTQSIAFISFAWNATEVNLRSLILILTFKILRRCTLVESNFCYHTDIRHIVSNTWSASPLQ